MNNTPDVITVAELNAMSDADFLALFPAAPAVVGFIVSLGQVPDLGPSCPGCLNLISDCLCSQLESAS